jgi:hypothetical protein
MRRFNQFVFNAEVAAEFAELGSAAETLRAEFEEEAVPALGAEDATGTWPGFDDLGVDAGLHEVVGAGEAGDSGADNQDWDAGGHGVREPSYHFEIVNRVL